MFLFLKKRIRSDWFFLNYITLIFAIMFLFSPSNAFSSKKIKLFEQKEPVISLWDELKDVQPKEDKHFVVIVPSYNNKDWYQKNLDSIFMQKYTNYHVVYIDDASPDGTGNLVEKYVQEKKQAHRVTLIKNKTNQKSLANMYTAMHMSNDKDVALVVDGDDWFAHEHVLELLNKVYSDPNVWMTYGQLESFPDQKKWKICAQLSDEVIKKNAYRSHKWITSHLRTNYVWLFKKIKKEDLMVDGTFFPMAGDLAYMFPMLEMAGSHSFFIRDVLYIYNRMTLCNDDKVNRKQQMAFHALIRDRQRYEPILPEAA